MATHYNARHTVHRNLAASKRSIVVVCATFAMVLGTTSVGASFFGDEETADQLTTGLLQGNVPDSARITSKRKLLKRYRILEREQPLVVTPSKTTPSSTINREAGTAAAAAVIDKILPDDNETPDTIPKEETPGKTLISPEPAPSEQEQQPPTVPPEEPAPPQTETAPDSDKPPDDTTTSIPSD